MKLSINRQIGTRDVILFSSLEKPYYTINRIVRLDSQFDMLRVLLIK